MSVQTREAAGAVDDEKLTVHVGCLRTGKEQEDIGDVFRAADPSSRNLGGSACSSRTRTPRPITVAKEQCVIVGVISTTTVLTWDCGEDGCLMWMSGRFTTASDPKDKGCSGSEILEIKSNSRQLGSTI